MPAGSPRTRATVLAVVTAALLGGVLVLRPDLAAGPADLVTDGRPPLDRERLAGTPVGDLVVAADGVGPLLLGTAVEDLLAAGWRSPSPDVPGAVCARLPRTEVDGGVLSGWASDGAVVAAQLEVTGRPSPTRRGPVGAALGTPVTDAEPSRLPDQEPVDPVVVLDQVAGETGTVDVGSATWVLAGSTVTVSDLGTGVARVVEVAVPGITCRLTPEVLRAEGDVPYPGEVAAAADLGADVVDRLARVRAGAPPRAVGLGLDADACSVLVTRGEAVVTGEHAEGAELGAAALAGELYGLTSGTRARTTRTYVSDAGAARTVTQVQVEVSSVVVEPVDSFAPVRAAARLEGPCPGAGEQG